MIERRHSLMVGSAALIARAVAFMSTKALHIVRARSFSSLQWQRNIQSLPYRAAGGASKVLQDVSTGYMRAASSHMNTQDTVTVYALDVSAMISACVYMAGLGTKGLAKGQTGGQIGRQY
jgi:hypothetical protein